MIPMTTNSLRRLLLPPPNYVVSGDTALLRLKDHPGIRMVKPAEFLRLLRR